MFLPSSRCFPTVQCHRKLLLSPQGLRRPPWPPRPFLPYLRETSSTQVHNAVKPHWHQGIDTVADLLMAFLRLWISKGRQHKSVELRHHCNITSFPRKPPKPFFFLTTSLRFRDYPNGQEGVIRVVVPSQPTAAPLNPEVEFSDIVQIPSFSVFSSFCQVQ